MAGIRRVGESLYPVYPASSLAGSLGQVLTRARVASSLGRSAYRVESYQVTPIQMVWGSLPSNDPTPVGAENRRENYGLTSIALGYHSSANT